MPTDLKQTAFTAWGRARNDIYGAWMHETDPANLQPKVSKFNRELANYIREHPPTGIEQARLERCLDAIESPCSRRDEIVLRDRFSQVYESDDVKSKAVLEEVERLGLEPYQAPHPLPPIVPEQIHLVCWMAIEGTDGAINSTE
jgi:hypothetical protein